MTISGGQKLNWNKKNFGLFLFIYFGSFFFKLRNQISKYQIEPFSSIWFSDQKLQNPHQINNII